MITCLGLSFKGEANDMREGPSRLIKQELVKDAEEKLEMEQNINEFPLELAN